MNLMRIDKYGGKHFEIRVMHATSNELLAVHLLFVCFIL